MNITAVDESHDGDDEPQDEIGSLEARLEALAAALERCRKLNLLSKTIVLAGALTLVAILIGVLSVEPLTVLGSLTALVGGTVLFGSNYGTLQHTKAEIDAAERVRTELIDERQLRLVTTAGAPASAA